MKKILLVLLALAVPALLLAAEPVREWKSKSGKVIIKAAFDVSNDSDPDTVFLLKEGKKFKIPFKNLSQEDQEYVTGIRESSKSLDDEDVGLEAVEEDENARGLAVVPAGNQYALLIGVNAYAKPIKSLRFCVNDMELLSDCFEKIGVPKENIILVTDDSSVERRPTGANIRQQIQLITSIMGPKDQLTIAFSGHGAMVDGKSYLCPSDTNLDDKNSIVSREWAFEQLDKCKAKQKIFIIDACRDEVSFGDQRALSGAKTLEDPIGADTHGFILIASCDKTQRSWEHPELKHGVFTYFLAKGLAGDAKDDDGYVSIMNLFQYASAKTKKYVYHEFNKPQVPTFRQGGEMTDFCLAYFKKDYEPSMELFSQETAKPKPDTSSQQAAIEKLTPTSRDSFVWEGSKIVKFIGKETDVVIPKGAKTIGYGAFEGCTSIKSIAVTDGVIEIEYSAFNGCSSLTKIVFADSVCFIGDYVFKECSSLTTVILPKGITRIDDGAFKDCSLLKSIVIPEGVTLIDSSTFEGCSSLTSVFIPDGVTEINYSAFKNCSSLTSIDIPASVVKISGSAFVGCAKLKDICVSNNNPNYKSQNGCLYTKNGQELVCCPTASGKYQIPEGITKIEKSAFEDCSSLTSVVIPESVTEIGGCAFKGCSSLTSVTLPQNMTEIGYSAFKDCSSLTSVAIPKGVAKIDDSTFEGCSSLTSAVIPDTVTEIESSAFKGCGALTSIDIPDSVVKITDGVFEGCSRLVDIRVSDNNTNYKSSNGCILTRDGQELVSFPSASGQYQIPYGVTKIGEDALKGCCDLTSVTIPGSVTTIESGAFSRCSSLTSVTIPEGVKKIGSGAFYKCSLLKSIVIPSGVTEIESYTFEECASLTNVNIPQGVAKFGYSVFKNCSSLKTVTIPGSLTEIESESFYGCTALTSVVIRQGVKKIRYNAFEGCKALSTVVIPDSVVEISRNSFLGCTSLTNWQISNYNSTYKSFNECLLTKGSYSKEWELFICPAATGKYRMPYGIKVIGSYAFEERDDLTSVVISESVTKIDYHAFKKCKNLESVVIPNSVVEIGSEAFEGCTSLTSVTIPNSVTRISSNVFQGCTSLISITVPSSLSQIPDGFCKGCYSLKSVTIPNSVEKIGAWAFECCISLTYIRIPDDVTEIEQSAFARCSSLKNIQISEDNESFKSYDGCITSKDGTKLIAYPTASGTYKISDRVKKIESGAFNGCNMLTFIVIPYSVTDIGGGAFENCSSLTSVVIPNGVDRLWGYTFMNCTSLSSILIPESLEEFDATTFFNCISLKNINISKNSPFLKSVQGCILSVDGRVLFTCPTASGDFTIPYGVTEIGESAFKYCSFLTSVTIPDTVTKIGDDAFYECDNLKTVTIANMSVSFEDDHIFGFNRDLIIRAPSGSTAEAYAVKNDYKFEKLEQEEEE